MKLLLVLAAVLLAIWLWRRGRLLGQPGESGVFQTPPTPEASAPMPNCLHCGVHFPAEEAVQGESGLYCSSAHRFAAGDRVKGP